MKLIIGLGNQGMTYHKTRHNVGFMVIDRLARRHGVSLNQRTIGLLDRRPASVYGECRMGGEMVRLVMPLTMMNESGSALHGLEFPVQDLLVVCDDVNIPLGALRLRPQGGPGGHNGLASCLEALATEEVPRLRVGVGASNMPSDLAGFVLSAFEGDERPVIEKAIEQAADACEIWATEGIDLAMNRYNMVQGS